MVRKFKEHFKDLRLSIFILSIVFGISSWVVFSGVWVEAPLLLKALPEGWKIPSMIGAVSQLAQLGPVLLFFAKCKCVACFSSSKLAKSLRRHSISDRFIIYTLFAIGLSAGSLLALFWDRTLFIMGQHRSVAFFSCVFCLAILDCTCTIVFLTYVGDFRGNYITALYIGEGISSLLPSFFALLQGTGDDSSSDSMEINCINGTKKENNGTHEFPNMSPRFSVSAYFWLLFGTLVISFVAFLALDLWPGFKKEKIGNHKKLKSKCSYVEKEEIDQGQNMLLLAKNAKNDKIKKRNESLEKMILLIGITIVSFVLYGFIPGLSSYSALPYGHSIMHLCVTLALITQPFSSLIATFVQIKSTKFIIFTLILTICIASYIFVISCLSPCPPLKNHWLGGYLMISAWILSYSLLMYLRCCITSKLKKNHGEESLVWCGLLSQLGQFIGSIAIYILVDLVVLFKQGNECNPNECIL